MKITHIGIYAMDLERSREYYMTYFGCSSNERYDNTKGFTSYFLRLDTETTLELMHHVDLEKLPRPDKSVGLSHLAISVGSKENVIALTNRITADGYELYSAPRGTGDGYFESCVADPDGNRVEITI